MRCIRLARLFVHGIVKALLDREATEGTAQELSAVELKKRMDTLDALGGRTLQVVHRGHRRADGPRPARARHRAGRSPASASSGIAVGFGAQSLVQDYLNGALILIENQFGKGDVVRVAGVAGTVEDFTLRRTTLRDLDGVVHTVPNGEIQVASNLTRVWSRINQDVTVAYGTDIDKAIEVVDDVGREMAGDPVWKRRVLEAPRVERVEALGRVRRHAQDPRHRPGRRPVGGRRRLPQAPARRRSRRTASRSRGRSASSWPATRGDGEPGRSAWRPDRGRRSAEGDRVAAARATGTVARGRACAVGWPGQPTSPVRGMP